MIKRFLLFFLMAGMICQAQLKEKSRLLNDPENSNYIPVKVQNNLSPETIADYVAVDTMSNTFGPSSFNINPLSYDPLTDVICVVHRGNANTYAQGSGELWWNYSTDLGQTWQRSLTSVQNNLTSQITARYPSMTLFNPTGSTSINDLYASFAWPELSATFEYIGWGVSLGLEQSALAEIDFDPPAYSSSTPIFTDNEYVYWVSDNSDDSSVRLFRTENYQVVDKIDPPEWSADAMGSGAIPLIGASNGNIIAHAFLATFAPAVGGGGWEPGVSKSTDHGTTWSECNVVDWLQIPLTQDYTEIWDWKKGDSFVSFAGDMHLDNSGYAHIVTGLSKDVDTITGIGFNTLFEFIETDNCWDAKIIAEGLDDESLYEGPDVGGYATDPAIGQCGHAAKIAASPDNDFFVAQWVHHEPGIVNCDIYISWRHIDSPSWSQPVNITETPEMNEDGMHIAPCIRDNNDGTYTVFTMYWYEAGAIGPITALNPSVIYVAPVLVDPEAAPITWSADLTVADAGGLRTADVLTFGQMTGATNGIDTILGEEELPPVPPAGAYDARFNLPTFPAASSLIDFRSVDEFENIWEVQFQPGTAGYPMNFSWNPDNLPPGRMFLQDPFEGAFFSINMKEQSAFSLTNTDINKVYIIFEKGTVSTFNVNNGWNLVSAPVYVSDMSVSSLFPTASSNAFGFDGGYVQAYELECGEGYWLKFPESTTVEITGMGVSFNVPVKTGWNLIGPFDYSVATSGITSLPAGIIAGNFFGYDGGYSISDQLEPGKAYWIKVSADGRLVFPATAAKSSDARIPEKSVSINITDKTGKSSTMYILTDETSGFFEMPPAPPEGAFDVRFASGNYAEKNGGVINISGAEFPVKISVNGGEIKLNAGGESLVIKDGSQQIISAPLTAIEVSGAGLPLEYELAQNYPNPFNPSTKISFSIPAKEYVTLKVYSILGEEVASLISGEMEAGKYETEFDASGLTSGVYIYSLNAGEFSSTRKMMLIK